MIINRIKVVNAQFISIKKHLILDSLPKTKYVGDVADVTRMCVLQLAKFQANFYCKTEYQIL